MAKNYARVMFKWDKSLLEQLIRRNAGQRPNIVSVPLKSEELAAMNFCHVYGPDFHRILRLQNCLSDLWQYLQYPLYIL